MSASCKYGTRGDGFAENYLSQTRAWADLVPRLQSEARELLLQVPHASSWTILLEIPLYRLQRRIDFVVLAECVIVVEAKVGQSRFLSGDEHQVEEYCLGLRDFHEGSYGHTLFPVLWATEAPPQEFRDPVVSDCVASVARVGSTGLARFIAAIGNPGLSRIDGERWDASGYYPVLSVIQAATSIFAGNDVRAMARADASNLKEAASHVVELIAWAKRARKRALIFLTGVPGSGKALAGLQAVHDAIATGEEQQGDIVYVSGNTPLVTVLREALARSEHVRHRDRNQSKPLHDTRRTVRARIQHVKDFLRQVLRDGVAHMPYEHAVVFDEAQRAWDEKQGLKKFSRTASEPALLLQVMGLRDDWCACVCLVGGGQEINSGERGVSGWGDALRCLSAQEARSWVVFGPPDVLSGGQSTGGDCIGTLPDIDVRIDALLQLEVPLRCFRSPALNEWVDSVLTGNSSRAAEVASGLRYPIVLTRSLDAARKWLRGVTRGERRCGLVASSGARRLRADGLGETLNATDGIDIAHWYLNPPGDIRASYALEVPANEYTCQGLELDFVGICWGGNLVRDSQETGWLCRRLNGTRWQLVTDATRRRFIANGYRVLLTRAREGLVIWIPYGDADDKTREPELLDETAKYLLACGARLR